MNRRDIELLSSYLDGQLKPSDSTRLESRLSADPNLRAVLDDLRAARGLLRQLPMRKAPRDFRLTPKMVGKNPPLPRAYPAFRFVTALATMLLFFTVGLNFLAPQLASQQTNFGYGGGGAPEIFSAQAPAATEAPAAEAPPEESAPELAPLPTATFSVEDTARDAVTPLARDGETGDAGGQDPLGVQNAPPGEAPQPVPPVWQILLAGIALLGAVMMVLMRRLAANRWRHK
jgi:anti-sigma factor RsiW